MPLSREQIDRISTTGRDFTAWSIFGLAVFVAVAHALNAQWEKSFWSLIFTVAICPLTPVAFEVRAPIAMTILLLAL